MKGTFLTDRGKVRSHNEDAGGIYYNSHNHMLAVIADGMGGHQAGDVASQMAISLLQEKWEKTSAFDKPEKIEEWLRATMDEINEKLFLHAQENKECEGMGTTIVVTIYVDDFLTVGHIGDSRCYLLNQDGFKQITEDHSLVNALVRSGQLSKEDAVHHPRKNVVLRALGSEAEVDTDIKTITVEEGDILLLCSDGLTDKLLDEELLEIIKQNEDLEKASKELVQLANNRGGEDNISLILLSKNGGFWKEGDSE
ncbi:Stp1/IreP family PP2C-type Ser/Thr phosphatase [Oceanobacillus halophilus]|uniref:protein-serine/threonine phosphatase n=1 Tax=Oceanobacillus halophilus TaxID=930130 RepID=A0A495AF04_9BACI|nr:Stp1/IreP family PP2C-type Ser/Thr phosphatase [Oceanobacillus halophilus]RKQ37435.1 Stp1/IreP family PP2C-type Ser/Thr phosphatase [Oceanobacillus halophilus]